MFSGEERLQFRAIDPFLRPMNAPRWMKTVLILVGLHSVLSGIGDIVSPYTYFDETGLSRPLYPPIWQFLGMIGVAVGIGYLIAAFNPYQHWLMILIGFLISVCGVIAFFKGFKDGVFMWRGIVALATSTLIWWIPVGWILFRIWRKPKPEAS